MGCIPTGAAESGGREAPARTRLLCARDCRRRSARARPSTRRALPVTFTFTFTVTFTFTFTVTFTCDVSHLHLLLSHALRPSQQVITPWIAERTIKKICILDTNYAEVVDAHERCVGARAMCTHLTMLSVVDSQMLSGSAPILPQAPLFGAPLGRPP